jgi:hypothetical protein
VITEQEFVEQRMALGRRIHEHDGVFWEEVYPRYCKPAFIYRAFDPGEARPARIRSLLGFSHEVRSPEKANRSIRLMVLEGERLRDFSLMVLPSKKRNQVRRALGNCDVLLIEELEPLLERMREINISQAVRQEARKGPETPVRRYVEEAERWREQVLRQFAVEDREWWGAFLGGVLVAYMRTCQVDDIRIIEQTKADTEYLKSYPMDALYFSVLSTASSNESCVRVVNGRPMHASLNHYKEQFLFENKEYPYYSSHARLVEWGKRLVRVGT